MTFDQELMGLAMWLHDKGAGANEAFMAALSEGKVKTCVKMLRAMDIPEAVIPEAWRDEIVKPSYRPFGHGGWT